MEFRALMENLVAVGRNGDFASIEEPSEFGDRASLGFLAGTQRAAVLAFARRLPLDDRIAFTKAVARLEDSVGGLGSVTLIRALLEATPDPQCVLLDWILRNTRTYYYSLGAKSFGEYEVTRKAMAHRRAERKRKDLERQEQDRQRIADKATKDLPNAVRRGDVKAVRALIVKGADVAAKGTNGRTAEALAETLGFSEIAEILKAALVK